MSLAIRGMLAFALLALLGVAHGQYGQRVMDVNHDGTVVVIGARPSSWDPAQLVVLKRQGRGQWVRHGALPYDGYSPFWMVGDYVLVGGNLYDYDGEQIHELGPFDRPMLNPLNESVAISGKLVALLDSSFPRSESTIFTVSAAGMEPESSLPALTDFPAAGGLSRVAFDGNRLAAVFFRPGDKCGVLIFDRTTDGWKAAPLVFPEVCAADKDIEGGDIAIEGDRILLGAYPSIGGAAGELAFVELVDGEWQQVVSLSRPDQEGDYVSEEVLPHAFGARVHLHQGLIFTNGGYQSDIERNGASVSASTVMNGFFIIEKQGEDFWQTIKGVTYNQIGVPFGEFFEVRGDRLFVDSPLESGVFVFEQSESGWEEVAIVYPDGTNAP